MAPTSYYYMFSIIFVATGLFWLINLILIRLKGRSVFSQTYKAGTPEHKRFMRLASTRNLIISTIIFLLLLAHLIWFISVIIHLNTQDAYALLIIGPIFIGIIAICITPTIRKFSKGFELDNANISNDEKKRKHTSKNDDSWLS